MNGFKKNWYKYLAVLLLLYTIVFGMLVPLRPGIMKVDTFRAELGQDLNLGIEFYNTRFTETTDHRVWLRIDNQHTLLAENTEVVHDRKLIAGFSIPETTPFLEKTLPVSVIVDSEIDGSMVFPDAMVIVVGEGAEINDSQWTQSPVEHLSMKWRYAFPWRNILEETIRNTYFHVPMWFGMMILFLLSSVNGIRLVRSDRSVFESRIFSLNLVGTLFGILGILTGAVWAKYTWGTFWSGDIKQDMSAVTLLIFLAYFLLRSSMTPGKKRNRVTAVYTIFAFLASIPLLYIIPRMEPSLHPGSGGNPGFGGEDLDNTMRMVFYPAVLGWTLLGYWISNLVYRALEVHKLIEDKNYD